MRRATSPLAGPYLWAWQRPRLIPVAHLARRQTLQGAPAISAAMRSLRKNARYRRASI